jgi:hypothetical protein
MKHSEKQPQPLKILLELLPIHCLRVLSTFYNSSHTLPENQGGSVGERAVGGAAASRWERHDTPDPSPFTEGLHTRCVITGGVGQSPGVQPQSMTEHQKTIHINFSSL